MIKKIVNWYEKNHEVFPWRENNHAYAVWVSEIMLQQTTVTTVVPYFLKFMQRFPSINDLAKATIDDVLKFWQGLGYYRRAHHLHNAAKVIVDDYGGEFPKDRGLLLKLPGIGPYTASALSAIAHQHPYIPVDGNVYRVFARFFALEFTLKDLSKVMVPYIEKFEEELAFGGLSPSYFAQGLMDLGRTVCTPKNPKCSLCPIQNHCDSFKKDMAYKLPLKSPKKSMPTRYANCWIYQKDSRILLQKCQGKGLLAGLWQFPITDFKETLEPVENSCIGTMTHVFSHFKLIVSVYYEGHNTLENEGIFVEMDEIHDYALSTLMKKILALATPYLREKKAA